MLLHACGGFPVASRPSRGPPGASRGLQGPPGFQGPPFSMFCTKNASNLGEAEFSRGMVRLD